MPALLALTDSPIKALLVVALFLILNQIESYVLRPLIMGRQIHAHPAVVLSAVLMEELTDEDLSPDTPEEGETGGE